ncbi:MAG: hypothetical protein EOO99_09885 [Pedobacter sp.]|nr:MAG: hypothetical protein EOO99_09885 [Pedobacter sp.]
MRNFSLFLFMFLFGELQAQDFDTQYLKQQIESRPDLFSTILNHPDLHEVQVLYTQINRNGKKAPTFKTYGYNVNATRYFYPASTVKLPVVIFALEKLNELKIKGLDKESIMVTDSAFKGQTKVLQDITSADGKPSIAHYIKKVLITSDNDGYNRLFEFVGRATVNQKMQKYGLVKSRIVNRLAIGDAGESTKHSNPIRFYDKQNKLIYAQAASYDPLDYPLKLTREIVGKGYLNAKEELIMEPFSFENKNVFALEDQHLLMKKLMFPTAFPKNERFNLTASDYEFIYKYMSMLPQESDFPKYNPVEFWPTYSKMLFYGREKNIEIDPNVKIYNKYGDSYGFIIDNAYIVDKQNGIEFILTAVVQSNKDEIYNDGKYEYLDICYPFMKNIGKLIYDLEKQKKTP